MKVRRLDRSSIDAANDVLCDAFATYPVMRYVLGEDDSPARLRQLVELFTAGRWMRGHPILGVHVQGGRLVGVITMTPPGDWPTPPPLLELAERTWDALGRGARARYEAIRAAWSRAAVQGPHWHVNMLGVLPAHRGKGFGEALLEAARAHAGGAGLDLTTEDEGNLGFYLRRGFHVAAHTEVNERLSTWTLEARA